MTRRCTVSYNDNNIGTVAGGWEDIIVIGVDTHQAFAGKWRFSYIGVVYSSPESLLFKEFNEKPEVSNQDVGRYRLAQK